MCSMLVAILTTVQKAYWEELLNGPNPQIRSFWHLHTVLDLAEWASISVESTGAVMEWKTLRLRR